MPPLKVECDVHSQADPVPSKGSIRSPRTPRDEREVNYDKDITKLYEAITNEDWDVAIDSLKANPAEARTWVVRHHDDGSIMWRFLPIHSACARQPPEEVISSLIEAYRWGASSRDDQGLFPLHYACGNQASPDVIKLLLLAHSDATKEADPAGMLPIHYLTKWGPSDKSVVDMVLFANPDVASSQIEGGQTPIDLALEGDYPERDDVVASLKRLEDNSVKRQGYSPADEEPEEKKEPEEKEPEEKEPEEKEPEGEQPPEAVVTPRSVADKAQSPYDEEVPPLALSESRAVVKAEVDDDPIDALTVQSEATEVRTLRAQKELLEAEAEERREKQQTIVRLKAEVNKVRAEQKYNEAMMLDDFTREKDELRGTIASLEERLEEATTEVEGIQKEQASREEFIRYIEGKLANKDFEIMGLEKEKTALAEELEDIKGKYTTLKAGSETIDGHFFALSSSVKTLMEEQEQIKAAMSKRDEFLKKSTKQRQKKMQELINMEVELTKEAMLDEKGVDGEGICMNDSLQRQTSELETISSILNAAKEDGLSSGL